MNLEIIQSFGQINKLSRSGDITKRPLLNIYNFLVDEY